MGTPVSSAALVKAKASSHAKTTKPATA